MLVSIISFLSKHGHKQLNESYARRVTRVRTIFLWNLFVSGYIGNWNVAQRNVQHRINDFMVAEKITSMLFIKLLPRIVRRIVAWQWSQVKQIHENRQCTECVRKQLMISVFVSGSVSGSSANLVNHRSYHLCLCLQFATFLPFFIWALKSFEHAVQCSLFRASSHTSCVRTFVCVCLRQTAPFISNAAQCFQCFISFAIKCWPLSLLLAFCWINWIVFWVRSYTHQHALNIEHCRQLEPITGWIPHPDSLQFNSMFWM